MKLARYLPFTNASRLRGLCSAIAREEAAVRARTDEQLREDWARLRAEAVRGGSGIPGARATTQAFAMLREAARRTTGMRPYDVQMEGALCMGTRMIAEMATGEGKTLVAGLAAAYLSLRGGGVHVATVNRYLAERDAEIIRPILDFFGITLGVLREKDNNDKKRLAYQADVTYGTGYEFGFDYLRDQLKLLGGRRQELGAELAGRLLGSATPGSDTVQRQARHAVVDEIDSVLIDEAVTPLIISPPSGTKNPSESAYLCADKLAERLEKDIDFELDVPRRLVALLPPGIKKVYTAEFRPPDPEVLTRAWHFYLEQALRARHCFELNAHYLVRKDKVEIIDENTGRGFADRKWREGLHQAVEAKEGASISPETLSEVSMSRQLFFRRYAHLCGMTGTARECAGEMRECYDLSIHYVERHRPLRLKYLPDRVFRTWDEKMAAYVQEICARHSTGQPILAGTRSVQRSEELAELLRAAGVDACVINARLDEQEAELVARAGELGRITIVTNMVGRGTDIKVQKEALELGGLMVLGQERYDSPRLDRQLAGRAGRQGEPGTARFFLSADDYLFANYGKKQGETIRRARAGAGGEVSPGLARLAQRVQREVEATQRALRRQTARHDEQFLKLKRHFAYT